MDLISGFHQIEVDENNKEKTVFSTPSGHFEFNRMSFGLKSATNTFAMNIILSELQGTVCFCYLDDIVAYRSSLQYQ